MIKGNEEVGIPLTVIPRIKKSIPAAAGLCTFPEEYHYSSALFYEQGIDYFNMPSPDKG